MIDTREKERKKEIKRKIKQLKQDLKAIKSKDYTIGYLFGFGDPDVAYDFSCEVHELIEKYGGEVKIEKEAASDVR